MQRKFLTNLGLLLLLNLLIKPFWVFGIDRTVQNVVGVQEFGFYYAIFNFSYLFSILLDLGITSFNNKNIAQNKQLLAKHFSGIISLKLILGFLYFIVTLGVGLVFGYRGAELSLLALVGFNQFLLSSLLYLRSNISGMLMFRTESFMSVLDRTLMIVIMSFLLWGQVTEAPFKIEWFVYAQTASYLIAVVLAYTIVVLKSKSLTINWNVPFFLMILRKSSPFALLALLMTFYNRIDSVMLERLLPDIIGDTQSGIYAHAYRILEATNQMSFLFAVLLLPLFSHLIKQKQPLNKIIKVSFSLLFVATFVLANSSFFYSYEVMELLYDQHIAESSRVYSTIIFGVIAMGTSYVFGTLLTANGNMKQLNLIAGFSLVISLSLNVILVPVLQSQGSAIANLSALSFSAIAQLYYVQKNFKIPLDKKYLSGLVGFVVFSVSLAYFSTYFDDILWQYRIVSVALLSFIIAVLFRLLNVKDFIQYIKEDNSQEN